MTLPLYALLLGLVAAERLVELVVSRRNAAWSFARGGREHGRGHFPAMVALHGLFLPACLLGAWLGHALDTEVEIRRTPGAQAVTSITLERASGQISLSRPSGKVATLAQTGQPDHRIALPVRQLHECIAEELRRLDPDEMYGEVLTRGLTRIGA